MNVDRLTNHLAAPVDASAGEEVAGLIDIAARVERTLKPVPPAPVFRARLRDGLMMAAHHQQAHQLPAGKRSEPSMTPRPPRGAWGWLIGAAALGSAAGVIAVVLRSRAQPPKPAAQPPLPQ